MSQQNICPQFCSSCSPNYKCLQCNIESEFTIKQECAQKCSNQFNHTCINGQSVICGTLQQITDCNCNSALNHCKTCSGEHQTRCGSCMLGYIFHDGLCTQCDEGYEQIDSFCFPIQKLSNGAIVGSIITLFVILGIIVSLIFYFISKKKKLAYYKDNLIYRQERQ
ncbi:Cysteine-rich membrane protein 2 [Spironucleus salmonicida]|uniref:Cysteine-rich membrane protein 2 n=1 Tax=Spironucleus salmonicida TaxID=348837 RepID=A0A9P8RZV0_9EUKA|nr:Cysteine-rich membrane protein 2 [Spironucleus salmonicida]